MRGVTRGTRGTQNRTGVYFNRGYDFMSRLLRTRVPTEYPRSCRAAGHAARGHENPNFAAHGSRPDPCAEEINVKHFPAPRLALVCDPTVDSNVVSCAEHGRTGVWTSFRHRGAQQSRDYCNRSLSPIEAQVIDREWTRQATRWRVIRRVLIGFRPHHTLCIVVVVSKVRSVFGGR